MILLLSTTLRASLLGEVQSKGGQHPLVGLCMIRTISREGKLEKEQDWISQSQSIECP